MMRIWLQPEAMASSTPYWMMGLSTKGSISLGWALVAGRKRVPRPAAGNTALQTFIFFIKAVAGRWSFVVVLFEFGCWTIVNAGVCGWRYRMPRRRKWVVEENRSQ